MEKLITKYLNRTITPSDYDKLMVWVRDSESNMSGFKSVIEAAHYLNIIDFRNEEDLYCDIMRKMRRRRNLRKIYITSTSVSAVVVLFILSFFIVEKSSKRDLIQMGVEYNKSISHKAVKNVSVTLYEIPKDDSLIYNLSLQKENVIDKMSVKSNNNLNIIQLKEKLINNDNKIATNTNSKIQLFSVKVPNILTQEVLLFDGSKVYLNSNSELRICGDREVYLIGEAYFDIVENKNKPFIVNALNSSIEVLGTTFSVNAYPEKEVSVILATGKIKLKSNKEEMVMKPGEIASVNRENGKLSSAKCNIEEKLSWINGEYYFDETPLNDILHVLMRWYDVSIYVDSKAIEDLTFTGIIKRTQNISNILDMLLETVEFEFELISKKQFVIRKIK